MDDMTYMIDKLHLAGIMPVVITDGQFQILSCRENLFHIGRFFEDNADLWAFMKIKNTLNINDAYSILITQNKIYTLDQYKIANDVILVPGKFDGIEFNHQIMTICDLIRVCYYQQYYL